MAAATGRAAAPAPAGYTGEGRRGASGAGPAGYAGEGQHGERRRDGSGVSELCVPRSSGGEVREAAALAPLAVGEGAPGAGRDRHRAPASPHALRPQRAPVLRPGEWGRLGAEGRALGASEPACLRAEGWAGAGDRLGSSAGCLREASLVLCYTACFLLLPC